MKTQVRLAITTLPSEEEAKAFADKLIQAKLAQCVNVIPVIHSIYPWKGKICREKEWLLLIKTALPWVEKLEAFFKENHPYELPELVILAPDKVEKAFQAWILKGLAGEET